MRPLSIIDLEKLSGIKAHTLRAWERRYQVLQPHRTHGKTRFYLLDQLQMLLNIALLVQHGFRISQLAYLSSNDIELKIHAFGSEKGELLKAINHLIIYKHTADIEKFEEVLDSCRLEWGIDTTIEKVILPFLEKINLLAYNDGSAETHFVVTAIRKKLVWAIEEVVMERKPTQTALLFLAKGEHYDLLLLYMTYVLKKTGIQVLYMGTNVPAQSLKAIVLAKKPHLLLTYVTAKTKFYDSELVGFLADYAPQTSLYVATPQGCNSPGTRNGITTLSYKEVARLAAHS